MCTAAAGSYFRNISEMGDYGDLTVNTFYQDSTGYVWIGSDRGVLRCDGIHTNLFPIDNGTDSKPLYITSLASLRDGLMAVGTRRGLFLLGPDGAVTPAGDESPEVTAMAEWSADTILVGTAHGLHALDGRGNAIDVPQLPVANIYDPRARVMCMAPDEEGNLYVYTLTALFRLDRRTLEWNVVRELPAGSDRAVAMVAVGGEVWAATTSSGLKVIDTVTGSATPVYVNSPVITSLSMSPDGLYVGTDGNGVFLIDPATRQVKDHVVHRLNHAGSPQSNQVYSVMADRSGLLWIGYYQHGADYAVNNSGVFEVYDNPDFFNSWGVAVRTINKTSRYFAVGTRDGLMLYDSTRGLTTVRRPELSSDMVIAVKEYRGRLYVGTYGGGLSMVDLSTRRVIDPPPGSDAPFGRGHVFAMAVDRNDHLWIGTAEGLYRFDGSRRVAHFTAANSPLPLGNVYEVMFDSRGRGWVCTENGLCVFDPATGSLRDDIFPRGFVNRDKIRTVFEGTDSMLYFMPERGTITIASLDLDSVAQLDFPALAGADAKAIAEDRAGYIWITTNRGIVRWNKEDEVLKFGVADGLPSAMFLLCQPAHDEDGSLWFGNSNGLIRLDTGSEAHSKAVVCRLLPTMVSTDGDEGGRAVITAVDSAHYTIRLDRFCSNMTVDFSPFTYTAPDALTYEYSTDGGVTWSPIPYSMEVGLYNSFTSRGVDLLVRPEGNHDLVTEVAISMPRSFAYRVIAVLCIVAVMLVCYVIYMLLRRLRERYKASKLAAAAAEAAVDEDVADKPKYRSNPLSDKESVRIMKLIDGVMSKEKPFVDPNLKISQLAVRAGITSHRLSQVFSQYVNKNFYDYVNQYRVKEFKRIAAHGGASRYTLTAMAEKAGFSSRASFFRHFKEIEGISPGEYLKRLRN